MFGLEGGRIDISSAVPNNPVFGSGEGNFGAEPDLDVRLVALPHDGSLLLVLVLSPPGELDAAWEGVRPIVDSVELPD